MVIVKIDTSPLDKWKHSVPVEWQGFENLLNNVYEITVYLHDIYGFRLKSNILKKKIILHLEIRISLR